MKLIVNLIILWNISILLLNSFIQSKEITIDESKTKKTIDLSETKTNEKTENSIYLNINFKDKIKEAEEMLYSKLTNNNSLVKNVKKRKKESSYRDISTNTATNIVSSMTNNLAANSASNSAAANITPNKENKININDITSSTAASYKLISLNTEITINNEKTYGEVVEKAKFELIKGVFTSIIRKFSLTGSSDSLIAFKLSSKDVKIKEARIISNCLESGEIDLSIENFEEYVCVIGIFEEINAKEQNKVIEIEYKYVANNLLRLKDSDNGKTNSVLWVYDNHKRNQAIENIKLKFNFQNNEAIAKFKKEQFQAEPNNFNYEVKSNSKDTVISWDISNIKENEIMKVFMDFSVFNQKCRMLVKYI